MLEAILSVLVLALLLLVGLLASVMASHRGRAESLAEELGWHKTLSDRLLTELKTTQNQLADHLVMVRREGFITAPADPVFEPYILTDQHEADIEAARNKRED
jgi:hypothetical protein